MINKEQLAQFVKEFPRFLAVALLVTLLTGCDSGPTTGGTGNSGGSDTTQPEQPNIIDVNKVLHGLGVQTVEPPANGEVPLFAP